MARVRYRIGPVRDVLLLRWTWSPGSRFRYPGPGPLDRFAFCGSASIPPPGRWYTAGPCGVRFVYTPVWPTTHHGAGSTDYRSGLCPLLVLRLSCLFRGCFIGTLLPTHRDEIVPSHNFDGHFPDSPQLYMCVLNERKKRAHVVYRGGRGSGGQYRVERELLYFSTHDS
jgi:hypothetical protein